MKAKRILKVLTLVDSRYIEELYIQEDAPRRRPMKKIWLIAAIVAVTIFLLGSAYVLLNLDDLKLRDDRYTAEEMEGEFEMISLQGFTGTPNYQAAQEWLAFEASYDPDGEIMQSLSHEEMIMPEEYWSYNCYTPEMTAKVDEICAKYGLNTQGAATFIQTEQQLYDAVQINGILREDAKAEVNIDPQYFYKTGSFMLSCDTVLLGENSPWNYNIEYQFYSVMKTDFDDVFLNVGDIETYDQWEYTTWNGMQVLLALSPEKALVIVDNGTAVISINVLNPRVGDVVLGEQMMTKEALEAFADTFDFSFVSQTVSDADWEAAQNAEQAEADAYHAQQEEWINSDANPANQKNIADYIQHLIDYERTQDLHYGLYDLDGDGEYELLVGYDETHFGQVVQFVNGSAQVHTLGFFEGMYLCEGNIIEVADVLMASHGENMSSYYQYNETGAVYLDCVVYDPDRNPENPWYRNPPGGFSSSDWEEISEEEYNAVRAKYPRVEVKLKPISEYPFE